MQKAWVIAGSIGAHETLCLLLNISCEVPVVWCLMSQGGGGGGGFIKKSFQRKC